MILESVLFLFKGVRDRELFGLIFFVGVVFGGNSCFVCLFLSYSY